MATILAKSDEYVSPEHVSAVANKLARYEDEAEACKKLLQDIADINYIMKETSAFIKGQGEVVDTIQMHTETAQVNLEEGFRNIRWVSNMKAASLPITGAFAGCLVGGPIGLVAGFKIGAVAAVAGCVLGSVGGRFLKNKQMDSLHTDSSLELRTLQSTTSYSKSS